MNLMSYQAMSAGNHEFDFGLDHLRRLQELARFPILCSNVAGRGTALPCRPSAVVRVGSLSIGLMVSWAGGIFPIPLTARWSSSSNSAIRSKPDGPWRDS